MEFIIKQGQETRVRLAGKLDFASAPKVMDALAELKGRDISKIVFECKELTYIASAGIRVIIFAQQKIAPNMEICLENASEDIKEVIEMCGLDDFLEFVE